MKIGLYAGSFYPIHNAHLEIAKKIVKEKIVDKVIFVPAGDGYEKSGLVNGYKRYEMIELVIRNIKEFSVSDIEIINSKLYSYLTLDYFKKEYENDEIFFIMGSDNLSEFHLWKKYKYILNFYGIVVFLRNGQKRENFKAYEKYENIKYVDFDFCLSSTEIRNNIGKKEYDKVNNKIDERVLDYIREYKLYE